MLTRQQIIDQCLAIEPNPEHGPDQYGVVIDTLADECGDDLFLMTVEDAVDCVLEFMNM
jgi:hypothetical protein